MSTTLVVMSWVQYYVALYSYSTHSNHVRSWNKRRKQGLGVFTSDIQDIRDPWRTTRPSCSATWACSSWSTCPASSRLCTVGCVSSAVLTPASACSCGPTLAIAACISQRTCTRRRTRMTTRWPAMLTAHSRPPSSASGSSPSSPPSPRFIRYNKHNNKKDFFKWSRW